MIRIIILTLFMGGSFTMVKGQTLPTNQRLNEQIYVHTDQSAYLTGEYLWFSAYVMEAKSHELLDLSKVVYIELFDKDNQPVLQTKIAVDNGRGEGSLFIPASLVSGNYTFRAYTNFMKNKRPHRFFNKTLRIFNPFVPVNPEKTLETPAYDVQFFPEGGVLIDSIASKVAFRVADATGKGIPFRGLVISDRGDTITRFTPLKFGMGHFYLTPKKGVTYSAIIKNILDSTLTTLPLPASRPSGQAIHLTQQENTVSLKLWENVNHENPVKYRVKVLHGPDFVAEQVQITSNNTAEFQFEWESLPIGFSRFLLYDQNDDILLERAFFKRPGALMDITIDTDRLLASTREKIEVDVETQWEKKSIPASLSASIYRLDNLQDENDISIVEDLLLTSSFNYTVEEPGYYFRKSPEVDEALDNLMLVYGWTTIYKSSIDRIYIPEVRSQLLTAKVTDPATGTPVFNIPVYLSLPGKPSTFLVSYSDTLGLVRFELPNIYGTRPFVIQPGHPEDSLLHITYHSPYLYEPPSRALPPFTADNTMASALESRSLGMQMDNIYHAEQRAAFETIQRDSTPFFGVADDVYLLDDYIRFPSMLDVMKEYVTTVAVRRRKKDFIYRILDRDKNEHFDADPLILLDGVPVVDANKMIEYDPLLIEKMEVIPRRYILGATSFPGIISYSTYKGQMEGILLDENALVGEYDAVQWSRRYFSPVYEVPEQVRSRKPDMRTLLQWIPILTVGEDGKATFPVYTSDQPGRYLISVQGLSTSGIPGSATHSFEVKPQSISKK